MPAASRSASVRRAWQWQHSIASVYARPWRRSAYRRADPRLPHRMVPAYPPFGAFGFTTMPTVALCRPPGDTAVVPSRSTGQHALVIPSAAIWRCQLH